MMKFKFHSSNLPIFHCACACRASTCCKKVYFILLFLLGVTILECRHNNFTQTKIVYTRPCSGQYIMNAIQTTTKTHPTLRKLLAIFAALIKIQSTCHTDRTQHSRINSNCGTFEKLHKKRQRYCFFLKKINKKSVRFIRPSHQSFGFHCYCSFDLMRI